MLRTFWNSNSKKKYGVFPVDSGMSNFRTGGFCAPKLPNQGGYKKLQFCHPYSVVVDAPCI